MSRLKGTRRRGAIGRGEVGARQKAGGKGKVERGRMKYGRGGEREKKRESGSRRGGWRGATLGQYHSRLATARTGILSELE